MKKLFVAASLVVASFAVNAQDEPSFTSKNGSEVLPQAGDYGVSFGAQPLIDFVGNIFNNTANQNVSTAFPSSGAITVRKFVTGNTAYRAMLRLDLSSSSNKFNTTKDGGAAGETVEDKQTTKNSDIVIGAGLEKRRGSSRVQGIYGAMVTISKFGTKYKYDYGNALSATTGTFHDFGSNDLGGGERVTEQKISSGFGFGVLGFVGAEFFIAPKLSLGAEFQWGPSINMNGKLERTSEVWDGVNNTVKTTTTTTSAGGSTIGFGTGVTTINLNFFF